MHYSENAPGLSRPGDANTVGINNLRAATFGVLGIVQRRLASIKVLKAGPFSGTFEPICPTNWQLFAGFSLNFEGTLLMVPEVGVSPSSVKLADWPAGRASVFKISKPPTIRS